MKVGLKIDPTFWQKTAEMYESERDNNLKS